MKTFTLDWAYVRREGREAIRSYFAPLVWVTRLLTSGAGKLLRFARR